MDYLPLLKRHNFFYLLIFHLVLLDNPKISQDHRVYVYLKKYINCLLVKY